MTSKRYALIISWVKLDPTMVAIAVEALSLGFSPMPCKEGGSRRRPLGWIVHTQHTFDNSQVEFTPEGVTIATQVQLKLGPIVRPLGPYMWAFELVKAIQWAGLTTTEIRVVAVAIRVIGVTRAAKVIRVIGVILIVVSAVVLLVVVGTVIPSRWTNSTSSKGAAPPCGLFGTSRRLRGGISCGCYATSGKGAASSCSLLGPKSRCRRRIGRSGTDC
jgi:hypothetical protein